MKKIKYQVGLLIFGIIIFLFWASCDGAGGLAGNRNEIWQTVKESVTYTVTFDANGGGPVPAKQTVHYGGKAVRPDNPQKDGSNFTQWSTISGGAWDFDSDAVTKDITLRAQWGALGSNQININFKTNNGIVIDDEVVEIGAKIIQPEGLVLNRSFLEGWYESSGFTAGTRWDFGDPAPNAKSLTLYAKWAPLTATQYNVWFIADGGFPAPYDLPAEENMVISPPPDMTRGGTGIEAETFGGWYKNPEKTIPWIFEIDKVTSSIPLYAQWNPYMNFTVNFWAGPPDTLGHTGSPLWYQKIIEGGNPFTEAIPTAKTGYTAKWYIGPPGFGTEWNFSANINQNYTMQAKWTPIAYMVIYNSNGGNGSMSPDNFNYDEEKTLTANSFTRAGNIFAGWTENSDGTGLSHPDKQPVYNWTDTARTYNLYAQWSCVITFDKNNTDAGSTEANPQTKTVTTPATTVVTLPTPPTRQGWTFNGWNTEADGTGTSFTGNTTVTGTASVYAQWDVIHPTSVILNKINLTLNIGDTETLIATVYPADALNQAVSWSVNPSGIVSVDSGGKLTTIAAGTTTVTVTTVDGGKTANCRVTVIMPSVLTLPALPLSFKNPTDVPWTTVEGIAEYTFIAIKSGGEMVVDVTCIIYIPNNGYTVTVTDANTGYPVPTMPSGTIYQSGDTASFTFSGQASSIYNIHINILSNST